MGGFSANAWVTQCLQSENDLEKVLVLGKSLRDVMTRATITVIVGGNICSKVRIALEMVFDLVVEDGRCEKFNGFLTSDEIGKLFAFSLRFYKKIIYVKTNSFFIRNCDYLFDKNLTSGTSATDNGHFPSIFKPSSSLFGSLLATLEDCMASDNKMASFKDLTAFLTAKNAADYFKVLNDPCFISLNLDDVKIHENMSQWGIIHLNDIRMDMAEGLFDEDSLPTADVVAKEMYKRWMNIYKSNKKGSLTLPQENRLMDAEKIAVVGMSCRFPKSNNLNEFWKLLIEGNNGTGLPPVGRWTKEKSDHYFPEAEKMNAGFLSVADDEFDSKFFGISPKEVQFMDPQLRILMEVVWESLEHAGINPHSLSGTNGSVFLGTWKNDYKEIVQRVSEDVFRTLIGTTTGAMVARIAHWLGLKGPCFGTESDCAAGMGAVHMACNSLRIGQSNLAFACGANLLLKPFNGVSLPHFFAPDGRCKTFDESADGFGRADGCAVLILKRYSDAVRDGDRIWGLIRGSAMTQEGLSKSIGTPTVECEAGVMRRALQIANVAASEVSYVEAHGTGTALGDPVEVKAIEQAYGNCGREDKLIIGSVKTNIGHTEACSGLAGTIKVILSMFHEQIPPHRNLKKLNPKIQLESIPAMIPMEAVPWKSDPGKKKIAGVSSFGVSGADVHLILEEPDNPSSLQQGITLENLERPLNIIQISAKTDVALNELVGRFAASLTSLQNDNKLAEFANFAYTANTGRASLAHKAILIAKDAASALKNLNSGKYLRSTPKMEDNQNLCFLFTGQGSQYHGMGRQLYETSPLFRMHFDYCDHFLRNNYNFSLADVYFGSESSAENVHRTIYSQTGIFVVEYCLFKLWESWGVKPSVVVGHSLGEFGAAVAAGILNIQDALKLVVERSSLIDNLPQGKMLVIKADKVTVDKCQQEFGAKLDYAAFNSSEQTVVAGDTEEIMRFAEFLKEAGLKCLILQSSHAFHSKHMDPMLEAYRKVAEEINYKRPSEHCQFISGMLGKAVSEINAEYWVRHIRDPVNFLEASELAVEGLHCNLFLEVGPHPVLTTFILLNNPQKMGDLLCLPSLRQKVEDWEAILNALGRLIVDGGVSVDWTAFDRFYSRSKVGHLLPSYPFQRTKNWITADGTAKKHSKIISPLLGLVLNNPTDSLIFQNTLKLKALPYLRDHLLDFTLFPGAGYLEMLLSASFLRSNASSSKLSIPTRAISLQNFKIFAPLALTEAEEGTTLQIVVDCNPTSKEISAKIYHHEESQDNWIHHASGNFSFHNLQNNLEIFSFGTEKASILHKFTEIKSFSLSKGDEDNVIKALYKKQLKLGFKFGPSFKILSKGWKLNEEFLAEVSLESLKSSEASSYLLNPTLIDAMIQIAIFSQENNSSKLRVPTGCEKFIWFNELNLKTNKNCYIYSKGQSAMLFDEEGQIIAGLLGIETVSTNINAIKAACDSQVKEMPDFYSTKWTEAVKKSNKKDLSSLDKIDNTQISPSWLIFCQNRENPEVFQLLEGIQSHLDSLGRKKVTLAYLEEDVDKLFEDYLADKDVILEGIVFIAGGNEERNQELIGKPFLHLLQYYLKLYSKNVKPKCILLTDNQFPVGDAICENPSWATLIGMAKTILNEKGDAKLKIIDVNLNDMDLELILEEMMSWKEEDPSYLSCLRGNSKFIPKFVEERRGSGRLEIPLGADRCQLFLPESKTIQDLKFGQLETCSLERNDVEVEVKCCSLNFRDLFSIWKPSERFRKYNVIGIDFSGIVCRVGKDVKLWKVGDRVFGINCDDKTLPSHMRVFEEEVAQVPPSMTFAEASLFPVAFGSVYHSFVEVAKVEKGETVLIHTASGGVGLIGIQFAKYLGFKVICTAGSERKRAYLRSLGVEYVFNSRTTEFSEEIMAVTNGKGVDVVLNTLTSPGCKEATLAVCGKGARFVEISKMNIWEEEEVKKMRPDVEYSIVDVDIFRTRMNPWVINNMKLVNSWISNGHLKAVPYTVFEAVQIQEALGFLQKAKHIGKVVVTMPELNGQRDKLFNERSTYLITGGLGEIGTEVCKYMASQGARHFVLMGRSAPSAKAQALFQNLKEDLNCSIHITQGDIGNYAKCEEIIKWIESDDNKLPPLRGVMHVAGKLSDGLLENVSWNNFEATFNPKINGSWNLHELTKHLILEHFVIFSSIMSQVGFAGHGSHCSACSFQDSFAHFRNSRGYSTININWGQWAEIGSGTEAEFSVVKSFSPEQGIKALDYILRGNRNNLIVANLYEHLAPHQKYINWYLNSSDDLPNSVKMAPSLETKTNEDTISFWKSFEESKDNKMGIIRNYVMSTIKNVLRLEEDEQIEDTAPFDSMGMDSLMMLESHNALQTLFGPKLKLPSAILREHDTLKKLSSKLLQIISGDLQKIREKPEPPTLEQVWQLVLKDTQLPENISPENPGSECKPSEIKQILFTGATGHLGSHVLKDLLDNYPQLEKVYCLVRGKDPVVRLKNVLKEKDVWLSDAAFRKVTPIGGDIFLKKFGLNQDLYDALCKDIDAVVNMGAKVNFTEHYVEDDEDFASVRNTNVGGTLNILAFSCKSKTKLVLNGSTLGAALKTGPDGSLVEEWPTLEYSQLVTNMSYIVSKYVCDVILKRATEERGIPCKSFRFPELRERIDGRVFSARNMLWTRLFLYFFKMGVVPRSEYHLQVLPVDVAARLTTEVIFNDEADDNVYIVAHPKPGNMTEQVEQVAGDMGREMKVVELEEFRQIVLKALGEGEGKDENENEFIRKNFGVFQNFFEDKDVFNLILTICGNVDKDGFNSRRFNRFAGGIYGNVEPAKEILKRDIITAKELGLID